jgi:hypothetical protein
VIEKHNGDGPIEDFGKLIQAYKSEITSEVSVRKYFLSCLTY